MASGRQHAALPTRAYLNVSVFWLVQASALLAFVVPFSWDLALLALVSYVVSWWELDPSYWLIRLMAGLGLAWQVRPVPQRIYAEARQTRRQPERRAFA